MTESFFALALGVFMAASVVALWLLLSALFRLRRLRLFSVAIRLIMAVLFAALAAVAGTLALASWSYQRLLAEQEVARIAVRAAGPERFYVQLTDASGRVQGVTLRGDQWRLEGRIVRFTGWARRLGLAPLYRLERLSGRFAEAAREGGQPPTVAALDAPVGDLADLKGRFPELLGFIETEFGSGVFMPLFDGARYRVLLGVQGGFSAVPADETTDRELRRRGF